MKQIIKVAIKPKVMAVSYAEIIDGQVVNHRVEYNLKERMYHPDLRKALQELNGYLARVMYLFEQEFIGSVQVNAVEITGKEGALVILKGQLALDSGNHVKIQSDAIDMHDKECPYGFTDIEDNVAIFIGEVEQYCFNNKQAQLDAFDNLNDSPEENPGDTGTPITEPQEELF